ncbi:hypothetical protein [uncultured Shewanella sp.]|uniref:hypothetical protein n=1 Tax=uncultured Shewanella sp. TaxID=173975 RepID=UPI002637AE76|nr:hypothetical protein [uncultured Shewanella sp.]
MRKSGQYGVSFGFFLCFFLVKFSYAESLLGESTDHFLTEIQGDELLFPSFLSLSSIHFPFYQGVALLGKPKETLQVNPITYLSPLLDFDLRFFAYDYARPSAQSYVNLLVNNSADLAISTQIRESGVLINVPLSIVNMPINVGVTSKIVQSQFPVLSDDALLKPASLQELQDLQHLQSLNINMQLSMVLTEHFQLAISGDHVLSQPQPLVTHFNQDLRSENSSTLTAGVVYDWNSIQFSTDVELYHRIEGGDNSRLQFWHVGGDLNMFNWLDINLDYYYDPTNHQESLYSMGSEFKLGNKFSVDFLGVYSQSNHIQGLLRTSYDF